MVVLCFFLSLPIRVTFPSCRLLCQRESGRFWTGCRTTEHSALPSTSSSKRNWPLASHLTRCCFLNNLAPISQCLFEIVPIKFGFFWLLFFFFCIPIYFCTTFKIDPCLTEDKNITSLTLRSDRNLYQRLQRS